MHLNISANNGSYWKLCLQCALQVRMYIQLNRAARALCKRLKTSGGSWQYQCHLCQYMFSFARKSGHKMGANPWAIDRCDVQREHLIWLIFSFGSKPALHYSNRRIHIHQMECILQCNFAIYYLLIDYNIYCHQKLLLMCSDALATILTEHGRDKTDSKHKKESLMTARWEKLRQYRFVGET